MGCSRVNHIIYARYTPSVYVKCPVCNRWGTVQRKNRCAVSVWHSRNDKCAVTAYTDFRMYAENLLKTVCRVRTEKLRKMMRKGVVVW